MNIFYPIIVVGHLTLLIIVYYPYSVAVKGHIIKGGLIMITKNIVIMRGILLRYIIRILTLSLPPHKRRIPTPSIHSIQTIQIYIIISV